MTALILTHPHFLEESIRNITSTQQNTAYMHKTQHCRHHGQHWVNPSHRNHVFVLEVPHLSVLFTHQTSSYFETHHVDWVFGLLSEECTLSMASKNMIRKTSNDEIPVLTSEHGVQFLGTSRGIAHHNPFGTICGHDHVHIIRCGDLTLRSLEKSAPIKNIWVMWAWGIEWTDSKKDTKRRREGVD